MINFPNSFTMISDRGDTRCRNPAVVAQYMPLKAVSVEHEKRSLEKGSRSNTYLTGVMGSTPIPAGFFSHQIRKLSNRKLLLFDKKTFRMDAHVLLWEG